MRHSQRAPPQKRQMGIPTSRFSDTRRMADEGVTSDFKALIRSATESRSRPTLVEWIGTPVDRAGETRESLDAVSVQSHSSWTHSSE